MDTNMPMLISNLKKLLPNYPFTNPGSVMMDDPAQGGITGMMPRPSQQQQSPLAALAGSQAATGVDKDAPLMETPILDQYKNMIMNAPNPQDYQPSRTRRVLAGLAGMGAGVSPAGISGGQVVGLKYDPRAAMETQQMVEDQPYNKAMKRYSTQAALMGKGAEIEEKQVANKRMLQRDEALASARDEANRIREELGSAKNELAAAKDKNTFEAKANELNEKIREANQRADQAQQRAELTAQGQRNTQEWRDAQIAAQNARMAAAEAQHALDNARADKRLEDQTALHKAEIEKLQKAATGTETSTTKEEITPAKPGIKIPFTNYEIPGTGTPQQSKKITETTSTKQPINSNTEQVPMKTSEPNRQKAVDYLKAHNKQVTDANVKYLLDNWGKW